MIVTKRIKISQLRSWTGPHFLGLCLLMGGIAVLFNFDIIPINIPWLPVSVIGTVVAFYVGFKNNQAYDIPMKSLCRVLEIDLREMLGEIDLLSKVEAKNRVLM